MIRSTFLLLSILSSLIALARAEPIVKLDSATFLGSATGNVESFLGIPYVQPPTGNNRLRLPKPVKPYTGVHNASAYGNICPQHAFQLPDLSMLSDSNRELISGLILGGVPKFNQDEDCLLINIIRPAGISPNAKLPVAVWIHGGGSQFGSGADFDGGIIVSHSIAINRPVIYVSLNYRLAGFGFLPGKEVKDAKIGNLGLHDQRAALRWVKKYISRFGGDPTKSIIWGQSGGAISAAYQMVTNNGNPEGLFRGAFMQSGALWNTDKLERGQNHYDLVVKEAGCSSARDTLDCLRKAPYAPLKAAFDKVPAVLTYNGAILAYTPRVDGVFLTDNPMTLLKEKKIAKIPFVQGNTDDEALLFAVTTLNITTTAQLKTYLKTVEFPKASEAEIDRILTLYPEDPAAGSPFDTGNENAVTPQYKRISAIMGDIVFHAPKRLFMEELAGRQPAWAYLYKRAKSTPMVGSLHGADLGGNVLAGGELANYLVHFAYDLNPNGKPTTVPGIEWPQWKLSKPSILTFHDTEPTVNITLDNYRQEPIAFLEKFLAKDNNAI